MAQQLKDVIAEELRALQDCLIPRSKLILTGTECILLFAEIPIAIDVEETVEKLMLIFKEEKP